MHLTAYKIFQFITVLCFSGLKYFIGLINATFLFNLGFLPSVLLTVAGGMAGVFVFIYLDKLIIHYWRKLRGPKIRKVKITKMRRWIVRVRSTYGLAGIAILTPIFFQVPIGTLIAMRLIKDVKKVSLAMLASFTFFSLVFCGLYYGFGINVSFNLRDVLGL
jgi:hypothetical protein